MTHPGLARSDRQTVGINDGLVRWFMGREDVEDIISDLDRAFAQIRD